jgi:hypothetical protein
MAGKPGENVQPSRRDRCRHRGRGNDTGTRAAAKPAEISPQSPSTQESAAGKAARPAGRNAVKPAGKGPSAQAKATLTPLFKVDEFRTNGDKGYFYTLNPNEASSAVSKYKFTPVSHSLGYLSSKPFEDSITLYRMRFKPFSSYLIAISAAERDKLVSSGNFVNEGIMGYASKSKTGKTLLWRVANNNRWRIVRHDEVAALVKQGWHSDGPVGYAWKSA